MGQLLVGRGWMDCGYGGQSAYTVMHETPQGVRQSPVAHV